jgi:hypothetical protein
MAKRYEISDEDIDTALRYLELHDPENASRGTALAMLEDLQAGFHGLAHTDPERFNKLRAKLDDKKKNQNPGD